MLSHHTCVAIVGAGIAGLATAALLRMRGFTQIMLYQRDDCFEIRRQGYGLTILQGRRTLKQLCLLDEVLHHNSASKNHYIFTHKGELLGFFGATFWRHGLEPKKAAIHIPRQLLRRLLLQKYLSLQPNEENRLRWSHSLSEIGFDSSQLHLAFKQSMSWETAQLVIGCDGFNSQVRKLAINPADQIPLNYLGILVVLGITKCDHFLANERVFQTVDGSARLFAMPFCSTNPEKNIMWQLSFPLQEETARSLSKDAPALKEYAQRVCKGWHSPVPDLIEGTPLELLMGVVAYDREPSLPKLAHRSIVLLGDAAHPMSPFKGQGANQALLDASNLVSRMVPGEQIGDIVTNFHSEMMDRARSKIFQSRERAVKYHCQDILAVSNYLYEPITERLIREVQSRNIDCHTGEGIEERIRQAMIDLNILKA